MMTIKDYAEDMNLTVEQVLALCDRVGIGYEDETTTLDDTQITLLDNIAADSNDNEEESTDDYEDDYDDEEVEEKAEELAQNTKFDIDNSTSFEKVKPKSNKKNEVSNNNKINNKNFLKERKKMYKHREKLQSNEAVQDENVVLYKEGMTVTELANALEVAPIEIVKKLMQLGVMANINQSVDYDTASVLVADFNKVLKKEESADISNFENFEIEDKAEDLVERPPVVTIMGHVDHGKTTLLDRIRHSKVASGEAGGITQHIGAYQVKKDGKLITFIDTPGHAAFTEMRARGANITDIVILVVAADDGVMPQTREAIEHAKAAGVPILVAINKMDRPGANPDRIKQELANYDLLSEDWGGNTIFTPISALTGMGVEDLLEMVILTAEMNEYKANPNRLAIGSVIEAKLDKGKGVVATLLVRNGSLKVGDPIVVGNTWGKIRAMTDETKANVKVALPSKAVEVTGLVDVPNAGDRFMVFSDEKTARLVCEERIIRKNNESMTSSTVSLANLFANVNSDVKELNLLIKGDVQGSIEALHGSLDKLNVEGVKVNVVRGAVGAITETDISLAIVSKAIIVAFNVRSSSKILDLAKEKGIEVRYYDIIYKLLEDIEAAMKGLLDPVYEEKVIGEAEVRETYKVSKVGTIAGSYVINGIIERNCGVRLIRDSIVVYTGKLSSLKRFKDDVKEVKNGFECGLTIENFNDIKVGDRIEAFKMEEVK